MEELKCSHVDASLSLGYWNCAVVFFVGGFCLLVFPQKSLRIYWVVMSMGSRQSALTFTGT